MSKALTSVSVVLVAANTAYNIAALVRAIDSGAPGSSKTLLLQNDPDNASNKISLGDSNLSTSRRGYKLALGDAREYPNGNEFWTQVYALSSVAGVTLNVELAGAAS